MANRDNGDDKYGRRNQKFNIDSKAFESEDDFDFESDDDAFINPSQKKTKGDSHRYDWCDIVNYNFDVRDIQTQRFVQTSSCGA